MFSIEGEINMTAGLISKDEAIQKIRSGEDVYIIDARSEDAYTEDSNQIIGAIHLPETIAHEVYMRLPKDREYLIYTGKENEEESKRMADFFREKGFIAYAIKGGFQEWRDSALPIEPINASGTPLL
jgi:rhodanese-related sulfurtransferase